MAFSAYLDNALVAHAFGSTTFTKPTLYLALTISGVEVSGNGYARQATAAFTVVTNTASNASNVDFPVATPSGWGTVDGAAIYDAPTGGNLLASGTLTTPKAIGAGDIFRAPASSITVTLT